MYALLRRIPSTSIRTSSHLARSSRSLPLSTSSISSSLSLSDRLRQRRQGSTEQITKDPPPHQTQSDEAAPLKDVTTSTLPQGNLPAAMNSLTARAIRADPVEEKRKRKERRKAEDKLGELRKRRRENALRVIEIKKRDASIRRGEREREEDGTEPAEIEPKDPLASDLRRRMGFSNEGRSKRDLKRALRIARLASGGELTEGEKEKLKQLQSELKALRDKRRRMVPWDALSRRLQKMEVYKIEKRIRRDEDREKQKFEELKEKTATPSNFSVPTPTASPPPSASFDESISSLLPEPSTSAPTSPSVDKKHQRAHHVSPYSPPNSPPAVVPSSSQIKHSSDRSSDPPLSGAALARLNKKLHADAARKSWTMRRSTIDQEIEDLENAIQTYLPPSGKELAKEGVEGPRVPKPKKRKEPPLLDQFVKKLQVGEKGKGKAVESRDEGEGEDKGTEEAARMLMKAVRSGNRFEEEQEREKRKVRQQEDEQKRGGEKERRGRISPRMEREERLRIARSRPYQNHPALQPSSSTHNPLSSSSSTTTAPLRELSSYPNQLSPSSVPFSPTPSPLPPVPVAKLSHSLSRTLFNPGVHFLRDPRSGVYNFSPEILENVPKLAEFEFDKLPQYVTSSKDEVLKEVAKREGKLFSGSTSSTVGMLCQIYFWLSKGKEVNTSMLSEPWAEKDRSFSMGQQLPVSVVLNYNQQDGSYSIDADKSFDATSESNVLADYGHLMEKLLTTDPKEFKRFLVGAEDPAPSEADHRQAYHYAITENMVLRSQLDAVHDYLPGNGTFDLKTRGTVAIRQDRMNYEESAGYKIDRLRGPWESFEREYYDLIRSAFLKYQFQARIGCMDGIFVAYHSTARFYGFQYLPISEMDEALFENHETGKQVFKLALGMLERLLKEAADCFKGENVNVTFAADTTQDVLRLFVTPHRTIEEKEKEKSEGREGVMEKKLPMTLLEVRGMNYLDGELKLTPIVIEPNSEGEVPVWQVGYEIKKSTGQDEDVAQDATSHNAQKINELFFQVRETQKMFSSIMLPTGITVKDIKEATERAKESGVDLDPSDLSIRFPLDQGVDYRGPTKQARALRSMSRKGKERTELEEKEREGEKIIVVKSSFEVLE
ncbi:hypothetical protein JCM3765_005794 [Sporobolomyces pararoseus]